MELYEQYLAGKTAEQLAQENGIPVERIELRLRAATAFSRVRGMAPRTLDRAE